MDIFTFNWREWEPFKTEFLVRSFHTGQCELWEKRIADAVATTDNSAEYVQAFIDVTLGKGEKERHSPPHRDLEEAKQRIFFVQFFWILYTADGDQQGQREAETFVGRYRKELGFEYAPVNFLRRFWEPHDDQSPPSPGHNVEDTNSAVERSLDTFGSGSLDILRQSEAHLPHASAQECNPENTLGGGACDPDAALSSVSVSVFNRDINQAKGEILVESEGVESLAERKRKAEDLFGFDSDLTSLESDDDETQTDILSTISARSPTHPSILDSGSKSGTTRDSRRKARLSETATSIDTTAANQHGIDTHHRRKQRKTSLPVTVYDVSNLDLAMLEDWRFTSRPSRTASNRVRLQQLAQADLRYERRVDINDDAMSFVPEDRMLPDSDSKGTSQPRSLEGATGGAKGSKGKAGVKKSAGSSPRDIAALKSQKLGRGGRKRNPRGADSTVVVEETHTTASSGGLNDVSSLFLTGQADASTMISESPMLSIQVTQESLRFGSDGRYVRIPRDCPPLPAIDYDIHLSQANEGSLDAPPPNLLENGRVSAPMHSNISRPPLLISPPIWAQVSEFIPHGDYVMNGISPQSRQELCESCDFFKSYQGGVYHTKSFAKGYLLGGFPALRDVFHENGKLIISHGGGKAASKVVDAEDQSAVDHSVSALLKTHRTKQPIVLIADDKYAEFPFDLTRSGKDGYAYIVLGYYLIRDFWAERHPADNSDGYAVRYKFAFQWCGKGEPWWAPAAQLPTAGAVGVALSYATKNETCSSCNQESPQIYKQGWMCLHSSCVNFFHLSTGTAVQTFLQYSDAFLRLRSLPEILLPELYPAQPITSPEDGIITTPLFYRGWHCTCGRLSSRVKWEHWQCAACATQLIVAGKIRSHKEFWGSAKIADYEHFLVDAKSGILSLGLRSHSRIGYFTFVLPNNWGRIHMIVATALSNAEVNDIFRQYQVEANTGRLPFRRFPLKSHQCRGTLLTNYFSQNCGAPYQYVGGADRTLPFDQCPSCVIRARKLIEDRASLVLGERPRFNELLNAAYMEKQSMSFHADNERGLGPIVSSLSMGSSAIMKFRSVHDKKAVLNLVLRHGDVVVMEGSEVQGNYEHTVIPQGFRIAATARWIGDENMSEGAWR